MSEHVWSRFVPYQKMNFWTGSKNSDRIPNKKQLLLIIQFLTIPFSFAANFKKMPVNEMKVPQLRATLAHFKQDHKGRKHILKDRLKCFLSTKFKCEQCDTRDWYTCCCYEILEMLEKAEMTDEPSTSTAVPTLDDADSYIPDTYLTCTKCDNWLECNCPDPETILTETPPPTASFSKATTADSTEDLKKDKKAPKAEGNESIFTLFPSFVLEIEVHSLILISLLQACFTLPINIAKIRVS